MSTNVAETVPKRAIELVVGDRIDRAFLPRLFGVGDPEVVFVTDHRVRRDSFVFVAVAYEDGHHDSTSFLPGAEVRVFPAAADAVPRLKRDTQTCATPGDQEHDHATCEDAVAEKRMPKLVTAERAREIIEAGGAVHRDERYTGDYRYIVDDMGSLARGDKPASAE
jgi:hypothetical protein